MQIKGGVAMERRDDFLPFQVHLWQCGMIIIIRLLIYSAHEAQSAAPGVYLCKLGISQTRLTRCLLK